MYKYDLYISYNFHEASRNWITGFIDKLNFFLQNELGYGPNIFFNNSQIDTGANWKEVLSYSLKSSKCLLCFWTPTYFHSEFSLSEWQSFAERENSTNSDQLIFPVILMGGEYFPPEARNKAALDVREYFSTFEGFWASIEAMKLEIIIKQLAGSIAKSIVNSPEYSDQFPIVGILGNDGQNFKEQYSNSQPVKTKIVL